MPRFSALLLVSALPLLAACATAMEGSTQQVTFKTAGAEDAYCNVQTGTNDYRYDVRPPQSIWVQKSRKPMFVSCHAPGNRTQNATVESQVAGATYLNGLNGGIGAGWDAESGAMYKYPDEVTIDFAGMAPQPSPLPSYENRDTTDPRDAGIEYMGPDVPALQGDKMEAARINAAYEEAARMEREKAAFDAEKERRLNAVDGGFYGDKGGANKDNSKPYTPPKTDPSELKDDKTSSNAPVSVAPLSEAVPSTLAAQPDKVAAATAPAASTAIMIPQAPSLGKPIFPSSTSF